ncbi:MAG: segregation/condensation protein A [Bacteroidia bacterium]|nr:segregation/condensation protein A [Bacteroidia bacterium]MDW8332849.1 segregation/condensation protein A [Bacteroidia bacterium]
MFREPPYRIRLPIFEGPFDLLLFFIERDEIDVYDIPIAKITEDFIDYLRRLNEGRIEAASEFFVVAAKLMKIKAATLLPAPESNDERETASEDPRKELADRLAEYKTFKQASEYLNALAEAASLCLPRGYCREESAELLKKTHPDAGAALDGVTLYHLMRIYAAALDRLRYRVAPPSHAMRAYPYTVEEVWERIEKLVASGDKIDFVEYAEQCPDVVYLVFSFLCFLEMLQRKLIRVIVADGFNRFWFVKREAEEKPEADRVYMA